jgi:hypothetical protein
MKIISLIAALLFSCFLHAQKSVFFRNIDFDSSYAVIGIGQHLLNNDDSFPQFWFIIDNPGDLIKLQKDWIFKNEVSSIRIEQNAFDIFIIRDKRTQPGAGIIYPKQGIIKSETSWYKFDMAKLNVLHREHPLRYHTKTYTFDSYTQYAAFGNSLLNDSSLLFFFEPYLKYEGKFTLTVNRKSKHSDTIFDLHDLNRQMASEFPKMDYNCTIVENDEFNMNNTNKVRFTIECSKALYDKYKNKYAEKGEWQPAKIEVKTFWRD